MKNKKLYEYVYETISCAHDEPIGSPQYHDMRMMIEAIEKVFIDSGVMHGEVKTDSDGKHEIHGDAVYKEWYTFKIMLLCDVTPNEAESDD